MLRDHHGSFRTRPVHLPSDQVYASPLATGTHRPPPADQVSAELLNERTIQVRRLLSRHADFPGRFWRQRGRHAA